MNEKVFCPNCKQWKHGHKIGKVTKQHYEDNLGSEDWIEYKIKIHRHHKGDKLCSGSDKIIPVKK